MEVKAQREDELPALQETYQRAVEIVEWNIEELEMFLDEEGYPEETAKWVVNRIRTSLIANYETDTHQ